MACGDATLTLRFGTEPAEQTLYVQLQRVHTTITLLSAMSFWTRALVAMLRGRLVVRWAPIREQQRIKEHRSQTEADGCRVLTMPSAPSAMPSAMATCWSLARHPFQNFQFSHRYHVLLYLQLAKP